MQAGLKLVSLNTYFRSEYKYQIKVAWEYLPGQWVPFKSKRLEISFTFEQAIKMTGFMANIEDNETKYIFSTYQKCLNLFSILFKQELDQDVSKVFAKFQRISYIRF